MPPLGECCRRGRCFQSPRRHEIPRRRQLSTISAAQNARVVAVQSRPCLRRRRHEGDSSLTRMRSLVALAVDGWLCDELLVTTKTKRPRRVGATGLIELVAPDRDPLPVGVSSQSLQGCSPGSQPPTGRHPRPRLRPKPATTSGPGHPPVPAGADSFQLPIGRASQLVSRAARYKTRAARSATLTEDPMPSGRSSEASAQGSDDPLELVDEPLAAHRDTL